MADSPEFICTTAESTRCLLTISLATVVVELRRGYAEALENFSEEDLTGTDAASTFAHEVQLIRLQLSREMKDLEGGHKLRSAGPVREALETLGAAKAKFGNEAAAALDRFMSEARDMLLEFLQEFVFPCMSPRVTRKVGGFVLVDPDALSDRHWEQLYRFKKGQVTQLVQLFELEQFIDNAGRWCFLTSNGRDRRDPKLALLVFLRYMAWPVRWVDLYAETGYSAPWLSLTFTSVLRHLYDNFARYMNVPDYQHYLDNIDANHNRFFESVGARMDPEFKHWRLLALVDGFARPIAKPSWEPTVDVQRGFADGHKKGHKMSQQVRANECS